MTRKTLGFALITALLAAAPALAQTGVPEGAIGQEPAPPAVGTTVTASPEQQAQMDALTTPTLTTEVKLTIQNAAQELEILQLKAQQIAMAFEQARARLQQLIAAHTPEGYVINDKLELQKVAPKKEPGKQ